MADPEPPPQIDGKVLRSMMNLITNAVQVHRLSLEEACGRAWGYGHAYHAWLPAEALDAAIRYCCARLQPLPRRLVLAVDGVTLHEIDDGETRMTIGEAPSRGHGGRPASRHAAGA